MILKDIIDYLEELAPPRLQESYDNSGLIVGNGQEKISKAIVCLDAVECVVDEAIAKGAELIIAHHPIVFGGLKKLNGKNYVERVVIKAIKHNIAIYAIHTNLDNVADGVNAKIVEKIGLKNPKILAPKMDLLNKLVFYVPTAQKSTVLEALFEAGAGNIGNYSEASFSSEGIGTFKGNELSKPVIGSKNVRESVAESRVEVLLDTTKSNQVLSALIATHPYEEVAYDLIPLKNTHQNIGSGMLGEFENAMDTTAFLKHIKTVFNVPMVKHTKLCKDQIKRVALCGGSGSFLLKHAIQQKADAYISADFKYHEFFDADNQLVVLDVGHYESEQYTSQLLIEKLTKKFRNFAFLLTESVTNPVEYFI